VNGGQAAQLGDHIVARRVFAQRRQQGREGAVGIAELGVEELRRAHQAAPALRRIRRGCRALDEQPHQIRPALLARVGAFQLPQRKRVHRRRHVHIGEGLGLPCERVVDQIVEIHVLIGEAEGIRIPPAGHI
jgi:hypothetical protein